MKRPFNYPLCVFIGQLWLSISNALGADAPTAAVEVRVVSLHDADTVKGDLSLGFGVVLKDKTIRAYGYDAWEVSRIRQTVRVTNNEIERGKQAKSEFEALIAEGKLYAEDSGEHDPYGRVSAWLWVRKEDGTWVDVAKWMKARGHCRE